MPTFVRKPAAGSAEWESDGRTCVGKAWLRARPGTNIPTVGAGFEGVYRRLVMTRGAEADQNSTAPAVSGAPKRLATMSSKASCCPGTAEKVAVTFPQPPSQQR